MAAPKPLRVRRDVGLQDGRGVGAGDEAVALVVHQRADPPRNAGALAKDVTVGAAVRGGPRPVDDARRDRLDARVRPPALVAVVEQAIGLDGDIVRGPLEPHEIDGLAPDVVRDDGAHGAGRRALPCSLDAYGSGRSGPPGWCRRPSSWNSRSPRKKLSRHLSVGETSWILIRGFTHVPRRASRVSGSQSRRSDEVPICLAGRPSGRGTREHDRVDDGHDAALGLGERHRLVGLRDA